MSSSNDENVFKIPYDIYRENSASKRWKMLATVVMKILREGSFDGVSNLGQLFINYELFTVQKINDQHPDPDGDWFEYTTTTTNGTHSFIIRQLKQKLTFEDFEGVDNSGNVCIWPSEQALAFYLLHNPNMFNGKSVLELGGGMTCLAGLAVAKFSAPSRIELTDGNVKSVENVSQILRRNDLHMRVICSVFEWGVNNSRFRDVRSKVDVIIAADCLYSKRNRSKFLKTLTVALKDTGVAFIFAPKRDNIIEKFEKEAFLKGFRCTEELQYNNIIWDKHLFMEKYNKYNAVKHYPLLILLTRIHEDQDDDDEL
ncbi:Uncharacterized protein GBIM_04134 [Gryllus bimaculatus]|nr:Uncharacterized protein GBIM_04134 [Gryllus bimaculatus]